MQVRSFVLLVLVPLLNMYESCSLIVVSCLGLLGNIATNCGWFDPFQVMPQLLNYLGVDEKVGNSLDWGTLCVYSCSKSCATGNNYTTEFIWKQDFAADR